MQACVDGVRRWILLLFAGWLAGCGATPPDVPSVQAVATDAGATTGVLTAGFVAVDGVYNSELMAPYDILHHSIFRDTVNYIRPFVVSPDGQPVTTFEGLSVGAHHGFDDAPPIDILVIPSAEGSMTTDLADERLMGWLRRAVTGAQYVITLCDGAFPLAATGALDGRVATTFPADRDRLAEMFPSVDVRRDAFFVVDGRYLTSVGGARSYEPALFLLEMLYGAEHARRTAEGLVIDWDVSRIPHVVVPAP